MQNVWRSDKRYCSRQEIRENGGTRRRPQGGHLLSSGKNRDETEGRRSEAPPHRSAQFWKNLLGRSPCLPWNQDPDNAPPRTRLTPCCGHHSGRNKRQRPTFTSLRRVISLSLVLLVLLTESCSREAYSPAHLHAIHDRILWTLRHDDADKALNDVNGALASLASRNLEWTWRLKVLKAQILLYKSHYQEALWILREPLPASLTATDIAVRKTMMEGIAHRQAQQFPESHKDFTEAEQFARASHPQLLGDVLNARGALEVDEKKFAEGQLTFEQALTLMRQERNHDGEASVLNNLARVAMSLEHFDEAIDRAHAALDLSSSLGLKPLAATVLGNLGWSYFEVGDFERALDFYRKGAQASAE